MKQNLIIFYLITILVLSPFTYPFFSIYAEEINKEEIKGSILEQINNKTKGINDSIRNEVNEKVQNINPYASTQNTTNIENAGNNTNSNSSTNTSNIVNNTNNNNADINQNVNANANTGYNEASYNISIGGNAGGIFTGDASVNIVEEVNVNGNKTTLTNNNSGTTNTTNIANTGKSVTTSSNTTGTTTTIVNNNNTTIIHQATNANANTGGNKALGNISIGGGYAGKIVTGNATVNVSYLATANGNVVIVGGTGGNAGPGNGANIYILNTGRNFSFTSKTTNNQYIVVTNNNKAVISQMCGIPVNTLNAVVNASECIANTGNNNSSGNINLNGNAGIINTGNATVEVNMYASVNKNKNDINSGATGSSQETDIVNTGNNVGIDTYNSSVNDVKVINNNDAKINQNVNAYANTGYNKANRNIAFNGDAGIIYTGNATVNVYLKADVNENTTRVNEDSASLAQTTNNSYVYNTGDNTTISTTTDLQNTKTYTNNNYLSVTQNVQANANSGGNNASGNIGCIAGLIQTGNATTHVNETVEGNNNEVYDPGECEECIPSITPYPTPTYTIPSITPTPTTNPNGSPQNETITVEVASAVRSSDNNSGTSGSTSSNGYVLGAKVKGLPKTGFNSLIMLLICITLFVLGRQLQKIEFHKTYIIQKQL